MIHDIITISAASVIGFFAIGAGKTAGERERQYGDSGGYASVSCVLLIFSIIVARFG